MAGVTDTMRRLAWGALRLAPVVVLLAAWEVFARSGAVTPFMLPALSTVAERIYDDALGGDLFINIGVTLYRALTGFAIAAVGGVVLGAAMARNAAVRWFFDPII
jgi:taurine transport system permease protein